MTLDPWFLIGIWAIIILILNVGLLELPIILSKRKPDPFRDMPFESGQVPQGEARTRLLMQYYPFLLMFTAFDVVAMFLFAWGMAFRRIPLSSSLLVLVFIFLLAAPLAYGLHLALNRENW